MSVKFNGTDVSEVNPITFKNSSGTYQAHLVVNCDPSYIKGPIPVGVEPVIHYRHMEIKFLGYRKGNSKTLSTTIKMNHVYKTVTYRMWLSNVNGAVGDDSGTVTITSKGQDYIQYDFQSNFAGLYTYLNYIVTVTSPGMTTRTITKTQWQVANDNTTHTGMYVNLNSDGTTTTLTE